MWLALGVCWDISAPHWPGANDVPGVLCSVCVIEVDDCVDGEYNALSLLVACGGKGSVKGCTGIRFVFLREPCVGADGTKEISLCCKRCLVS